MPLHDWTRVDAGIFHAFHLQWLGELAGALNQGILPADYYALPEQFAGPYGPDVLTLSNSKDRSAGGTATLPRPKASVTASAKAFYRRRARSLVIHHVCDDDIVAVIEIVSSGNKSGKAASEKLLGKALDMLEARFHLILIDLYPPTRRDPQGIHGAIWDRIGDDDYEQPADHDRTAVAYECAERIHAYVEPLKIGDLIPAMPLFLEPGRHVLVPFERAYQAAFAKLPKSHQEQLTR